ncbi:type IV pilus twitching motility protein PilT [Thermanaerovibrio acidaminovorans]|uniref:Twitching motility protein n=1 Tax=Thermanaerovibrio acidaminovorans (strain ATCC 49978 / DSM 6589 / Su883) TaxID=525903 RepID=D1B5J5_THEAS|nr:type IV pilus twitching motility protein PilT [Thermanaerovibrio acidaminovorans]ACZ19286.1 twitching motility protein [Thermanaerovibrio acidaminovorans DSM 6589]
MSIPSLKVLLYEMIRRNASDLHISSNRPPMLRVDGTLIPFDIPDLTPNDVMEYVGDLLPPGRWEEFTQNRELDFSFTMMSLDSMPRFRVNCFFEKGNPAIAIRFISTDIRTTRQLRLPMEIDQVAEKMRGLFLVTGPTGSGKSTTLAALVHQINMTRSCHVVTVEDPIEYVFKSERAMIHQREVGDDTKSFSEALKRVLRQDPDVIMIGEMRDLETISSAITAAETGHLVLATLHTPDAAQTVDRIVDVFPPYQQQQVRLQLANILIGICSQQLIPLASGGRVVATEFLWATPGIRNCIREGKTSQIKSMMQTGSALGMHTMDQDLVRLHREGILTREMVDQYCFDPKEVEHLLGGAILVR